MKRARICFLLALTLIFVLGFGSSALATTSTVRLGNLHDYYECVANFNWDIAKSVDPSILTLKSGESGTVTYTIDVTKEEAITVLKKPYCKLYLTVWGDGYDAERFINTTITAWVEDTSGNRVNDVEKLADNQTFEPSGGVGQRESKTYSFNYTPDLSLSSAQVAAADYRIAFHVEATRQKRIVGDWENEGPDIDTTKTADFSDFCTVHDDPITVQDNMGASDLPSTITYNYHSQSWNVTDAGPITYPVQFVNNGDNTENSYTFQNIASIVDTDTISDATVTINVTPKPTKKPNPPEPREERKVRYPDPTPSPDLEAASVELPKTGGFIEWEWIALAGGMLASGGGALYLVRRRKMKK